MKLNPRRLLTSIILLGAVTPVAYEVIGYACTSASPRIPIAFLVACSSYLAMIGLLHVRRLETQILSRAVIWAFLVTSVLMSIVIDDYQAHAITLALGLGTGTALLLLGTSGLNDPSTSQTFVPVAFRSILVAILIMAVADMSTLLFWGGLILEDAHTVSPLLSFMLTGGTVMLLAVYGLYRLRAWGFGLNILANIAIAVTAFLVPKMPVELATCLAATAIGQLLIGLPLLRGIAKGGHGPQTTDFGNASRWSRLIVAGLMTLIVAARITYEL